MQQQQYQVRDVIRVTGLGRQAVQYWLRKGVVKPDFSRDTSQGIARLFSTANLIQFALAKKLGRYGIEAQHLAPIMRLCRAGFRDFWDDPERIFPDEKAPLVIVSLRGDDRHGFYFTTKRDLTGKGLGALHAEILTAAEQLELDLNAEGSEGSEPAAMEKFRHRLNDFQSKEIDPADPRAFTDLFSELVRRFPSILIVNLEAIKREVLAQL